MDKFPVLYHRIVKDGVCEIKSSLEKGSFGLFLLFADGFEGFHHVVFVSAEVIVELDVFGV